MNPNGLPRGIRDQIGPKKIRTCTLHSARVHNNQVFTMEDNWREVEQVVSEFLDLPSEDVQRRLEMRGLPPEIRRRAEELLLAWRASDGFLDPPNFASAVADPDRLLGEKLGCWRLAAVIGSGGMGTV